MKKTDTNIEQRSIPLVAGFIVLFVILCSPITAGTGNPFSGVTVQSSLTGSGTAAGVQFLAELKWGNSMWSAGPVFQCRNMNVSGIRFQYHYYLNYDSNKNTTLFIFGCTQFNHRANFSEGTMLREMKVSPESTIDYSRMRVSILECYGGFGLKFEHSAHWSSVWNIGAGGYFGLDRSPKIGEMYREKHGASVLLGMGLRYSIKSIK